MSTIKLPPLPEPVTLYHRPSFLAGEYIYITGYTADQMHAHAAAVTAAKDERIKVLEDALRELVGACDDDSATRFEDALSAAREALRDKT